MADVWTTIFVSLGCLFYLAGTVGILRFGDLRTRLHALTKADTMGLGLVTVGLLPQVAAVVGLKLVLIWALALGSAAVIAYLLAGSADDER